MESGDRQSTGGGEDRRVGGASYVIVCETVRAEGGPSTERAGDRAGAKSGGASGCNGGDGERAGAPDGPESGESYKRHARCPLPSTEQSVVD